MSLVRDPDSIPIFADAAIYVASTASPTVPATIAAAFGSTWDNLGVLNGDAGIGNAREWDETEHFGWGTGLYRIGRKNYKETRTATCLESNATTELLTHGASTTSANVFVNRGVRRKLAFEYTDDFGSKERWFTTTAADIWIPNLDRNESDPSGRELTIRIFADGTGKTYTRQVAGISQALVVTGTGNYAISYGGQTASSVAATAPVATLQTTLEGLSSIGTGNVTVAGTVGNYTITKLQYLLGTDSTGLTGGTATVARS